MSSVVSTDRIIEAVRAVLGNAASGKGEHPHFLTTYQLLERFPDALRDELIFDRAGWNVVQRGSRQGLINRRKRAHT